MHKRVGAGLANVHITLQVIYGVEEWVRLPTFGGAILQIMTQRIHAGGRHIGHDPAQSAPERHGEQLRARDQRGGGFLLVGARGAEHDVADVRPARAEAESDQRNRGGDRDHGTARDHQEETAEPRGHHERSEHHGGAHAGCADPGGDDSRAGP